MCTIIVKERGVNVTPLLYQAIKNISKDNKNGMGFAYKRANQNGIFVQKGFTNPALVSAKIMRLGLKRDDELIVHARLATAGEKTPGLTQPFPVIDSQSVILSTDSYVPKNPVMAHNGTMFNFVEMGSKYSDTYHFIKQWLADETYLMKFREDPNFFLYKYKALIGHQKFAFIHPEMNRELTLWGDFKKDWGGLKFSNNRYKGQFLTVGQVALINKYSKDYKEIKEEDMVRVFNNNPVKDAIDEVLREKGLLKSDTKPEEPKKEEKKELEVDTRVFCMELPENYVENKVAELKKQIAAKDAARKEQEDKRKKEEESNKAKHGSTSSSRNVYRKLQEALKTAQKQVEESNLVEGSYKHAISGMNLNYLINWTASPCEMYIDDVTRANYKHFVFFATRDTPTTMGNKLYEIDCVKDAESGKDRFFICSYNSPGSKTSTPITQNQLTMLGSLIPRPTLAYVYEGLQTLVDKVYPTKSQLKKINKKLADSIRRNSRYVTMSNDKLTGTVSIHSVKLYLEYFKDVYDVANQHLEIEMPVSV